MELEQMSYEVSTKSITHEKTDDFPEKQNDELDLPPEYCHYRDNGCEFADSCLNCPFTKCLYDEHGGRQHHIKRLRNEELLRLFTAEGKGIREL